MKASGAEGGNKEEGDDIIGILLLFGMLLLPLPCFVVSAAVSAAVSLSLLLDDRSSRRFIIIILYHAGLVLTRQGEALHH